LHENEHILTEVVFTGDSLIAVDHDGVVRIWNTTTWAIEDKFETRKRVTAMDVSPNGRLLAIGFGRSNSIDSGIMLWDVSTRVCLRTLSGHRPFALAFSPDGRTLVSTSERHDVVLWDVTTGMQLRTVEGHITTVAGAAFSPDGTKLATTDFAGNLRIHDAATLAEIDRHPLTLRSMFRLGALRNRERRFGEAEAILRRTLSLQKQTLSRGDAQISQTRKQLAVAIDGRRKQSEHPPPSKAE
jgi:WD40 repeat protein